MPQGPIIQAVVFDAVGTLIYAEPGVAEVYAAVAARYGSRFTTDEIRERFKTVFEEIEVRDRAGALVTSEELEKGRWRDVVARVIDDVHDPGCFAELFAHFARPDAWRLFPDVAPALRRLARQGVELAIGSNFDERLVGIARAHAPPELCRVFVSSRLGYRKPHPRFFRSIAAALARPPEQILYVGDDPQNDVSGAHAVGMRSLLVDRRGIGHAGAIRSLDALAT